MASKHLLILRREWKLIDRRFRIIGRSLFWIERQQQWQFAIAVFRSPSKLSSPRGDGGAWRRGSLRDKSLAHPFE